MRSFRFIFAVICRAPPPTHTFYIRLCISTGASGLRQSSEKNQLYASCERLHDKEGGCFRKLPGRGQSASPLAFLESLCTQALHLKPVKLLYCLLLPFQTDFMAAHLKLSGLKPSSYSLLISVETLNT